MATARVRGHAVAARPPICTATTAEAGRGRAVRSGPGRGLLSWGGRPRPHTQAQGLRSAPVTRPPRSTVGAAAPPTMCAEVEVQGAGGLLLSGGMEPGARSPEPGSQAPCTSAATPVAGGRASASVRITSGARRPLTEGLSRALQGVNRSHWPLPATCQQQGPSHCDYPRQRQTRSNAPEGVGVGVGTTNRPLWRTTALRRGRQHGLRPMGVTSPTLPGPVRCELRDTPRPRGRQTRAGAQGRQARLPPAPA